MGDTNDPINGERRPSSVDDFRRAKDWYFDAGPGLRIQCRQLDYYDLLLTGELPMPVLERFAAMGGLTLSAVVTAPDAHRELLAAALTYASLAAVSPRISLTKTDAPNTLYVSADWRDSDLPPSAIVQLMNEGTARRLAVDVSRGGLFLGAQPVESAPAGSSGEAVRDTAERAPDAKPN